MEIFKLYYITLPLLSYTMITISSSITSTKNILNFLIETKETDILIFKNHLEEVDLKTKIKIIESLIYDLIIKNSDDKKIIDNLKLEMLNLINTDSGLHLDDDNNYYLVDIKKYEYFKNIDEPVLYSLISTCEVIYHINDNLYKINEKIITHKKSYLKNILLLKLQPELNNIIRYSKILDLRLNLLFDILKVYSPINKI